MITRRHALLSSFSCTTALMLPTISQAFPPFCPARFPLELLNEALIATGDKDQIGKTIVKVIGVGSAGRSMVKHMMADETHGTTFFYANRNTHEIRAALAGTHALFIVAGMGGDTGNDLATELARVAKNMGILTVGIAAMPFVREGADRMNKANAGLAEFETNVDSLIVLRNEEFLSMLGDGVTTDQAIAHANDVLKNTAGNIAKILTQPGHVAVDFEDFRLGLSEAGITQLGFAVASGLDRGRRAAELAVACPLLEGIDLASAEWVMVVISAAAYSLKLRDSKLTMDTIRAYASSDAHVIYGTAYDDTLGEEIRVTIIATGLKKRA